MFETAIGILLTGIMGIIAYIWQEKIKRETALTEHRKELYEELLHNFFDLIITENVLKRSEYISKIERSWLFASDKVLEACYEILQFIDSYCVDQHKPVLAIMRDNQKFREDFEDKLAVLFLEMRRDIKGFKGTKIDEKWAKGRIKVYGWGIISLMPPKK